MNASKNDPARSPLVARALFNVRPPSPHVHSLRIWPAVTLIGLMLLARFGPNSLEGGASTYWMVAVFGPSLGGVLLLVWWLTASRATWKERLFGLLGIVAALVITLRLADPTMRGPATNYLTWPMGMIGFALGAAMFATRSPSFRTAAALLLAFACFGFSSLLRNEGMTGDYTLELHLRWSQTPEAKLVSTPPTETTPPAPTPTADRTDITFNHPEWSGFRGADRASRATGPEISTNWSGHPPRQLWKIPVGPAWSSFAVAGKRLFTQEQRGPMEIVVCYAADTGQELWKQQTETRFDESLGGPGPRATPTLGNGSLFVTGATGTFLRLNPTSGEIIWKKDLKELANRQPPMWGFSASPLHTGSLVIIYAGGPGDKGILAFDVATGELRWTAAAGHDSYSSPQLNTITGEEMVLMLTNEGLLCLNPVTGQLRLNYAWKSMGYRALQPHLLSDNIVLLPTTMNTGTRAIQISSSDGQLTTQDLWTSKNLKTDFTDFVTHQGYAYGNDSGIFCCINLETGARQWKEGRYGKGQVLLLANSNLLLVATEPGDVVLLQADPSAHTKLGSFKALNGKTWNHPVVVGNRLYLRNTQEAACFELPSPEERTMIASPNL